MPSASTDIRTVLLGGCRADLMQLDEAVELIATRTCRCTDSPALAVVSVNLDHLNHFGPTSPWHSTLEAAASDGPLQWLQLLDGAPLVRQAARLTGSNWPRLAGSDLIDPLLQADQANGVTVGFLGGAPETQQVLAQTLPARYPNLRVKGWWAPPRSELADPCASCSLAAEVRDAGVDMLVVGLGKPRQELWLAEYGHLTGAATLLAFGAVVDFLAGRVRRAPSWVADHGLEWLWRLALEPRRLARRYLVQGPPAYVHLRHDSCVLRAGQGPTPSTPMAIAPAHSARLVGSTASGAGRFVGPDGRADVAVLVVTYNNSADIDRLFASLRVEARENRLRVIVADNASSDGTLSKAAQHGDVIAFSTGGNLGFAAGINRARMRAGDVEAILVLNPDLTVLPGALRAMRERLRRCGVGAVVPRVLDVAGSTYPSLRREPAVMRVLGDALMGSRVRRRPGWMSETDWATESYLHPHEVDWATGAAVLVEAGVAERVGDWDERFFLYSEETDFFRRVRAAGYSCWYEPAASVEHVQGGSGTSPSLAALMTVNRVRYFEKHHPRGHAAAARVGVLLGEALRTKDPGHRTSAAFLVNRKRWGELPRGESPISRHEARTPLKRPRVAPAPMRSAALD